MRAFLFIFVALCFAQLVVAGKGGLFKSPLSIFKSKKNDRNIFKQIAQVTIDNVKKISADIAHVTKSYYNKFTKLIVDKFMKSQANLKD